MKPCFNKSAATITKNQEIIKKLNKQFPIDQDNITDIRLNINNLILLKTWSNDPLHKDILSVTP